METELADLQRHHLDHSRATADANAQRIRDAGAVAVCFIGGPGCGKTSLINRTVKALAPVVRSRVIACGIGAAPDVERAAQHDPAAIQLCLGNQAQPNACAICDALDQVDLPATDLLLIENVGTLNVVPQPIGQGANVVMFSVAGGHDQPAKHPALTRSADAVVLNKTDLLPFVPFDQDRFRRIVHELNPKSRIFELSSLNGSGMEEWLTWIAPRPTERRSHQASHWFG